jgi:integrase
MYVNARQEIDEEFDEEDLKGGFPYATPVREDVAVLLECARRKPRDYLLLRLLYAAGLRRQEVASLLVADLIWGAGCILIRASKRDKDRYVLVDSDTMDRLRHWVGDAPPERSVFEMGVFNVSRLFRFWADTSGLYAKYQEQKQSLSPHSLRHAFATHSYENGLDFYVVSRLMGHTFGETTAIYLRSARLQIDQAYDSSQPFAAPGGRTLREHAPSNQEDPPQEWEDAREFREEFACQLGDRKMGYFAPIFPDRLEMRQMLDPSHPSYHLLRVMYAAGLQLPQALGLHREDLLRSERGLRLGNRCVRVDPATLELFSDSPAGPLFPWTEPQASAAILEAARRVGVERRFAALGRTFTPQAIRFAYAVHASERGMDRISLMNQLGHHYLHTTSAFFGAAVAMWRAPFDACQQLAQGGFDPPS